MRYFIYIYIIGFSITASAQDNPPAGEIEDAQIIIEKDKPLTLPKASRIYQRSKVKTVGSDTVNLSYDLSRPGFSFEPSRYSPAIRSYESFSEELGSSNYVKFGFGNYLSPLLEGYAGYQQEDKSAGLYVFHESFAKGPVRDEESAYGHSDIQLNGALENEGLKINPTLSYNREAFFFYGHEEDGDSIFINDKIGVNHVGLSVPISYAPSEILGLSMIPKISNTTMGYGGTTFNKDFHLGLEANGNFQINSDLDFDMGFQVDHYNYISGVEQSRSVVAFNPALVINNDFGLNLDLGVGVAFGSDSATSAKPYFYPDLAASYQINSTFLVYLEATGGVNATNLNDLRVQNRYLEDSLSMINEHTKLNLEAGVQYALFPDLVLEPFVGYQLVTNKQLFYPSASDTSRFSVVYDGGNFVETNIGVTVRYINSKSELIARMYLSSYQTDDLAEAWYLPSTTLDVSYYQLLTDELRVRASLMILQGLKAPSATTGDVVELSTISDLSVGADYMISDKFSAFLSVNNLFNAKYQRYLNYPVRGIAAKVGFVYRF